MFYIEERINNNNVFVYIASIDFFTVLHLSCFNIIFAYNNRMDYIKLFHRSILIFKVLFKIFALTIIFFFIYSSCTIKFSFSSSIILRYL